LSIENDEKKEVILAEKSKLSSMIDDLKVPRVGAISYIIEELDKNSSTLNELKINILELRGFTFKEEAPSSLSEKQNLPSLFLSFSEKFSLEQADLKEKIKGLHSLLDTPTVKNEESDPSSRGDALLLTNVIEEKVYPALLEIKEQNSILLKLVSEKKEEENIIEIAVEKDGENENLIVPSNPSKLKDEIIGRIDELSSSSKDTSASLSSLLASMSKNIKEIELSIPSLVRDGALSAVSDFYEKGGFKIEVKSAEVHINYELLAKSLLEQAKSIEEGKNKLVNGSSFSASVSENKVVGGKEGFFLYLSKYFKRSK